MNQYVSDYLCNATLCFHNAAESLSIGIWNDQLVCFYYVLTTFTTVGYGKCISNAKSGSDFWAEAHALSDYSQLCMERALT